ncbi:metal-dependent hydrolase [Nonomuraea roseoviolacea]|uniref:Alanyl-tRNA synthetase n=1 Tax=Nonomuraea roseoviolacea subsp. carminata TaxID=160689 RepID=A0ABT1K761_9ACTN|nr:metal-dependent hydrolase [Nonomuraea roseoviolacea]MCP2349527.1 alanyl-tRNA synthetase [Nonomuraea roseoviolacea subsp. carminata]
MNSTVVTFPAGQVSGLSRIVGTVPVGERHGLVVSETPFHPLDHTWPDQPADRGTIGGLPVVDCVTGAWSDGEIHLGADIPARRGAEGWQWLVVHVTDAPLPVGDSVDLAVDPAYRAALSAGHTACHLAALALNAALADRWRKEPALDALGRPDFDQTAITSSRIEPDASVDVYRLGKSLRKKGFTAEGLDTALAEVAAAVNDRLKAWVAADAPVRLDVPGPELTARRTWHCSLPEGEASIPCGGTHVTRTSELGAVTVELALEEGTTLTMRTTVTR